MPYGSYTNGDIAVELALVQLGNMRYFLETIVPTTKHGMKGDIFIR
jgi:hypothetical protein